MKIVFDSSVWVAFFNKKDSQHGKAEKIFKEVQSKVVIPEYIIIEVCSVLTLRAGKEVADMFLDIAKNNKDSEILLSSREFFSEVTKHFKKFKTGKFSFTDLSLAYLSNFYIIVTFDKDLDKLIKKLDY